MSDQFNSANKEWVTTLLSLNQVNKRTILASNNDSTNKVGWPIQGGTAQKGYLS